MDIAISEMQFVSVVAFAFAFSRCEHDIMMTFQLHRQWKRHRKVSLMFLKQNVNVFSVVANISKQFPSSDAVIIILLLHADRCNVSNRSQKMVSNVFIKINNFRNGLDITMHKPQYCPLSLPVKMGINAS